MALSTFVCQYIDGEKWPVGFPAKPGIIAVYFLGSVVIQRHFLDQIELHVQLNECIIFSNDVNILLSRR